MEPIIKKRAWIIGCWILLFSSCSDKYQSVCDAAQLPVLTFNKLHDSMSIREKDPQNITGWVNPILWMHSIPSMQQLNIIYSENSGKVHFIYRGVPMEDSKPIVVAGDSTSLFCHCDEAGVFPVDFYLTDQLGRISAKQLFVQCIANDKAKAHLFLDFLDSLGTDNWSYRLDATKTEKVYGKISGYYFSVDHQSFFSTSPVAQWIFHQRGEHTTTLYVIDDLGLHSDTITQKLVIP